jgi:feruloyl esterase
MNHCSGGPATDAYDGLAAIVNWVEKGAAPDSISARGTAFFQGRTRPLCAYPKTAHYKGSGSVEDAANFSCQ